MTEPAIQWVTTSATRPDGEPRGWKLHAIIASDSENFAQLAGRKAACGLRTKWGLDLFVDEKCVRCLRALGLDCKTCRGKGSCGACGGKREARKADDGKRT